MTYEVNVDNFDRNEWEQCAKEFADYSIYQTWPYQQVRGEMDGQQVSRVIIKDKGGHVVTMCQLRIKHIKTLGLRIGYVQSGPLMLRKDGSLNCLSEALKQLNMFCSEMNIGVLRVVPNLVDNTIGKKIVELLESIGFRKNLSMAPYHTFMISLTEPKEEIRARIHRDSRRILRKTEKMEIDIREGTNEEFFDILESLYSEAKTRKGFKGLDSKEFAWTQQMLASNDKATVLIAYYDDQPVTAHATTHLGNTAVPILTASNETGLRYRTSYLLWWKAYLMAKDLGFEYYDLGGIDLEKNPAGYRFKRRMGGTETFHIGVFEMYKSSIVKLIWKIADRVYRFVIK